MQMHYWILVPAGIFHAFHHRWISAMGDTLNAGLLPRDYNNSPEQPVADVGPTFPQVTHRWGRRHHETEPIRRPRLFRGDRRPGLQEGLSRDPELDSARAPRRARDRGGQGGLGRSSSFRPGLATVSHKHGGVDEAAFAKLLKLLRYVDGDYNDRDDLQAIAPGPGRRGPPAALPGDSAESVRRRRRTPGQVRLRRATRGSWSKSRSVAMKNRPASSTASSTRRSTSRASSGSTTTSARSRSSTSCRSGSPTSSSSRSGTAIASRACRSRWPRTSACRVGAPSTKRPARSATWSRTTCSRSSRCWRWSPPAVIRPDGIRDEKVKVLRAIRPLEPDTVVRGQYIGYREEKGVAAYSEVETFAAVRLQIDSWRWS